MVHERLPALAQSIVVQLEAAAEPVGCLSDLRAAGNRLDRHGFVGRPQWAALQEGMRPPPVTDVELSQPDKWVPHCRGRGPLARTHRGSQPPWPPPQGPP